MCSKMGFWMDGQMKRDGNCTCLYIEIGITLLDQCWFGYQREIGSFTVVSSIGLSFDRSYCNIHKYKYKSSLKHPFELSSSFLVDIVAPTLSRIFKLVTSSLGYCHRCDNDHYQHKPARSHSTEYTATIIICNIVLLSYLVWMGSMRRGGAKGSGNERGCFELDYVE